MSLDSGSAPASATAPRVRDWRDAERMQHSALRHRLMYGGAKSDILGRIRRQVGALRADLMGDPDQTANTLSSIASQVSVLYGDEPQVLAPEGSGGLVESIANLGLWPLMQRVQRDTWGLREMLVRLDVDLQERTLTFAPVYPHLVQAKGDPRKPSRCIWIREWRQVAPFGWCGFTRDITNPANPSYTVETEDGRDVTEDVLGASFSGADYDCRDSEERPYLPYAWYHAQATGWLFDAYTFQEAVECSLNVSMLLTFYLHVIQNASWPQRYMIGAQARGAASSGSPGVEHQEVVVDPTSVFQGDLTENATAAQIGQWLPGADPQAILDSIASYERRAILLAGLSPADVTRQEADIRSGYSLAVSNEAIRSVQKVSAPQFRRGDQELFAIAAKLSNRYLGTDYSEVGTDYRISYKGLQPSPIEAKMQLEMLKAKQDAGQIGPVGVYLAMNPTAERSEAVREVAVAQLEAAEVEAEVARLSKDGGAPMPPGAAVDPKVATAMADLLVQASSGAVSTATVEQYAASVLGMTTDRAAALAASITVRSTPPSGPSAGQAAA